MKKLLLMSALVYLAGSVAANAQAQNKSPALKKAEQAVQQMDFGADLSEVSGNVVVTKDKKTGEVTDLELLTQSGFKFKITRNEDSKALEAKNGVAVELAGVIAMKDGQKWLTIKKPAPPMVATDDSGKGAEVKAVKKAEKAERKPGKKVKFEY